MRVALKWTFVDGSDSENTLFYCNYVQDKNVLAHFIL